MTEGSLLGENVGKYDGGTVALTNDGEIEGNNVGGTLGFIDGLLDGEALGTHDG